MPFVGMKVMMEIPEWRGSDPCVPLHARGDGLGGRARPFASIGAVSPAMGFGDVADDAAPNKLAEAAVTLLAVALIAHLSGDLAVMKGGAAQFPGLGDVAAERLFAIDVLAR